MTREEAWNRIDAIIEKHEVDDVYVTINNHKDYDALRFARKLLEQEHCEDEYIKVPKKALKYRTAGMVAYNAEWLKNHFDIERAAICGAQQSCGDAVSRQAAIAIAKAECDYGEPYFIAERIAKELPPVHVEPMRWIPVSERLPQKPDVYTVTDSKGDVVRFVFNDTESSREYWLRCVKAWIFIEPYREDGEAE